MTKSYIKVNPAAVVPLAETPILTRVAPVPGRMLDMSPCASLASTLEMRRLILP